MHPSPPLVARDDFVLVIIDIQERLAGAMERRDDVVRVAARLARTAAMLDAPIIVTRQYPKGLGPTVTELQEVLTELAEKGSRVVGVDKTAFCCAAETDFMDALAATGRSQVVLAGMETHICVAQTALVLASEDRAVHVAADGCCSRLATHHDVALDRLRHAGVSVTTGESVMYEAVGRAGTDEFRRLLAIVKE
ncbi:MAG: isochorismatase family protein [Anaerosomatales bacterium]|nr:isochorismatase family protein [Anaerosomatales bacterium]MDT8433161.1 isochorismatase family protein [Anaerosomatales bacterium]